MKRNPIEKESFLRTKLDEYHVEIPDFPMKPKKRWERIINILASPAKNPIEPIISTANGFMLLKVFPVVGAVGIALIQILLFL